MITIRHKRGAAGLIWAGGLTGGKREGIRPGGKRRRRFARGAAPISDAVAHVTSLLLAGPTASGKSGLALEIAEEFGAVIQKTLDDVAPAVQEFGLQQD